MVRRSRGYAPTIVGHLAIDEPLLAVGADLKNTIALVVHGDVLVSQHIGDLGDLENRTARSPTRWATCSRYTRSIRALGDRSRPSSRVRVHSVRAFVARPDARGRAASSLRTWPA